MSEVQILSSVQASETDLKMIGETILDYMECWYSGEHERLARSLHPALVKRGFYPHRWTETKIISVSSVSGMIENVRAKALKGEQRPKSEWQADITILDVFQGIATAKAIGAGWVDYIHLARVDGEWKIINILYDLPPLGGEK